jgi:DNA-binding MarR family transcriptional regulator
LDQESCQENQGKPRVNLIEKSDVHAQKRKGLAVGSFGWGRAADDRRYNIIKMTVKGKKLLAKVEPLYARKVKKVMACLGKTEQKRLVSLLEKIRERIAE